MGDQRKAQWPNEPKVAARSRVRKGNDGMGHSRSTKDEGRSANYECTCRGQGRGFRVQSCGSRAPLRVVAKRRLRIPQSVIVGPIAGAPGSDGWVRSSAIRNPQSAIVGPIAGAPGSDGNSEFRNPQSEIRLGQSPGSRTDMKASWGISTWPTIFMRRLPAFCFSSSLRLRITSPP